MVNPPKLAAQFNDGGTIAELRMITGLASVSLSSEGKLQFDENELPIGGSA